MELVHRQQEVMSERWVIYDRTRKALHDLQAEIDAYWAGDEEKSWEHYNAAVEDLKHLTLKEWYQVRKYITPPPAIKKLAEVLCHLHCQKNTDWEDCGTSLFK